MKLTHDEMIDVISSDGKLSAMRYEFCRQMDHVWYIVLGGSVLIAFIILLGIYKNWTPSNISLLVGTIAGAVSALTGILAGIATAGKVTQTSRENAGVNNEKI
jgi:uncharacterized integral membrane protein